MSGQQVGSFVGGVIGAYYGGPYGYAIGAAIGGAIGGYIDPTVIRGPKFTDASQQTFSDGIPIPWGMGTFPTAGNVIWDGGIIVRTREDDGKGSGIVNVTEHPYRSYAIGICQGVRQSDGTFAAIEGILFVERNGKMVYDVRPGIDGEQDAQNAKFLRDARFHLGAHDQLPDSVLESFLGVNNAPAFPGIVYMVMDDEDLTGEGGAIPQYRFGVSICGTTIIPEPDQLELLSSGHAGNSTCLEWSSDGLYLASSGQFDDDDSAYFRVYRVINGTPTACDLPVEIPTARAMGMHWSPTGYRLLVATDAHELVVYQADGTTLNHLETITLPAHLAESQMRGAAWSPDQSHFAVVFAVTSTTGVLARWDAGSYTYVDDGDVELSNAPQAFQALSFFPPLGTSAGAAIAVVALANAPGLDVMSAFAYDYGMPQPGWPVTTSGAMFMPRFSVYGDLAAINPELGPGWFIDAESGGAYAVADMVTGTTYLSWSPDGYHIAVGGRIFRKVGLQWLQFQQIAGGLTGASAFSPNGRFFAIDLAGSISIYTGFNLVGGSAIPDAPGYYVDAYGNVVGPDSETLERCKPSLAEIVTEICLRSGVTADDIDVTELDDEVDGFKIATETTAEAMIAPLMQGWFFDAAEYDDKIRFIKRGQDVVAELTVDDLCETDGDVIEETELQEVELLRKVHVRTIDPEANFVPTTQTAERRTSTVAARGEQTTDIAVVTDKDTQARMADKNLKVGWAEVRRFKTCIPYTRPEFVPTDVIGLTDAKGRRQRVRLMEMSEDAGRIEISQAMLDRQSSYTSDVEGVTKPVPTTPPSSVVGPTFGVPMNLPRLRSADIGPGAYLGACGYMRGWGGCDVMLSVDGGVSYQRVSSFTQGSTMGSLTADCTESSEPISVFINSGVLSSITPEQLALRMNAFAITTTMVSEIGQFEDADQDTSGIYDLTNVVRGGLGTTPAAHNEGDPFVMLATVQFLPLDISLAGQTLYFKFVSFGTSLDDADPIPFLFQPQFFGAPVIEAYTDDADNAYTDNLDNVYYYEAN